MHLKYFIIIVIMFVVFNMIAMAQPFNDLTERELLIQLYSKLEGIEEDVNKMLNKLDNLPHDKIIESYLHPSKNRGTLEKILMDYLY